MAFNFDSGIDISHDHVVNIRWYLEGVFLLIIGALGLIVIWTELGFKTLFRQLISALLIFDTICIFCNIATFSGPFLSETYRHQIYPHLVPACLPIAQIALTGSVYMILAIAVERYLAISRQNYEFPKYSFWIFAFLHVTLCSAFNINRFFEYKTETIVANIPKSLTINGAIFVGVDNETGLNMWKWKTLRPTDLRQDSHYIKVSTTCSILISLIPFISIILLNVSIYKLIKKKAFSLPLTPARERRELYVATILVLIVMIYAGCHSIATIINVFELFVVISGKNSADVWHPNMNVLVSISHVLITINSASNFLIYCAKDTRFRTKFLKIISLGLYNLQGRNRVEIRNNRRPRLSIANIETLSDYEPIEEDQVEEHKHNKTESNRKMIRNSKLKQINVTYFSSSLETTDV